MRLISPLLVFNEAVEKTNFELPLPPAVLIYFPKLMLQPDSDVVLTT